MIRNFYYSFSLLVKLKCLLWFYFFFLFFISMLGLNLFSFIFFGFFLCLFILKFLFLLHYVVIHLWSLPLTTLSPFCFGDNVRLRFLSRSSLIWFSEFSDRQKSWGFSFTFHVFQNLVILRNCLSSFTQLFYSCIDRTCTY